VYLVPIHVPIFVEGSRTFLSTDWRRSLALLRDSLGERYGRLTVVAPSIPAHEVAADQLLEEVTESDGISLVPSFDLRCRARHYWGRERRVWSRDVGRLLVDADVVHGSVDDLYRPIAFEAFASAARRGIPTLLVQDTDQVMQLRELRKTMPPRDYVASFAYVPLLERAIGWSVRRASLPLLKGRALVERYGHLNPHVRSFHDTSHSLADVVDPSVVASRGHGPVRLVYCGRLVARKGIDHSLRIVAGARARGADVRFDVIGDGPAQESLAAESASLGLDDAVRFLGKRSYGPALFRELATYDALLFTPISEDTPRMIFDGYAAGLPLVGYDIAYVRERLEEEGAGVALPSMDVERSAASLAELANDRPRLAALGLRAIEAARTHSSETWYRRRAEWTFEAVERARAARASH